MHDDKRLPLDPYLRSAIVRWVNVVAHIRNRHLLLLDALMLPLAVFMAFAIRLDADLRPYALAAVVYALAAPLIKIPIFAAMRLYGRLWQAASTHEALLLGWGALLGGMAQGLLFLPILIPLGLAPAIPRSIPLLDILLVFVAIAVPRFGLRVLASKGRRWTKQGYLSEPHKRVLIAGAGQAGTMAMRELEANPQTGLEVIGFVDDDPAKQGAYIYLQRVLGPCRDIPEIARNHDVDQVIIAMPTATGAQVRRVVAICQSAGIVPRIVPGVYELLSGHVKLQAIRDVQIEDLLRREPVRTDTDQVAGLLRGRRVMVTGAGGSIGAELCRQIARFGPSDLIMLGHGENSLFIAEADLRLLVPTQRIHTVVGDLRDYDRLKVVFSRYQPEIVFHAAAHKHVPLMESNPEEAVTNNVLGTRYLLEHSAATRVSHFVLISTDKAINPTSVMGASKRVAEMLVQQAGLRTGRCYVAVRFGNVLGSRGSVVPFFQKQIAAGGPVTVTHPDMRRYFMTIPEAVQLVLQAAVLGCGGEVFVLDMGEPVRIVDLAADLIHLSGFEPGRDIEIVFTGARPGEKLFEELFSGEEAYTRTTHEKILVCRNGSDVANVPSHLGVTVDDLVAAARGGDPGEVRRLLHELVPSYKLPRSVEAPEAHSVGTEAHGEP